MKNENKKTKYEPSIRALARRIHLDRQTLSRHLQLPGAPGKSARGFNVETCLLWLRQTAASVRTQSALSPRLAELRERDYQLRIARAQFALEKEQGLFLPRAEVMRAVQTVAEEQKRLFYQTMREAAPRLAGLDAVALGEKLLGIADEICLLIQTRSKPWTETSDPHAPPIPAPGVAPGNVAPAPQPPAV